tara:strand:+ start:1024 stop:1683 length:660 start_codon:yes stop_codon:yes gene_type:complete
MEWKDEGYLLFKKNFSENSIKIDVLTLEHGKYTGIVYGGSSRKSKKIFQIGNKILLNWKSKSENKSGYLNVELINPVTPLFFDDKKKSICILSGASLLKILLPENQINKKIFLSFENLISNFNADNWISLYIFWELSLIKDLGYDINFLDNSYSKNNKINLNGKTFNIPKFLFTKNKINDEKDIIEALTFNKNLFLENIIIPNRLKVPISRNLLENYFK